MKKIVIKCKRNKKPCPNSPGTDVVPGISRREWGNIRLKAQVAVVMSPFTKWVNSKNRKTAADGFAHTISRVVTEYSLDPSQKYAHSLKFERSKRFGEHVSSRRWRRGFQRNRTVDRRRQMPLFYFNILFISAYGLRLALC